MTSSGRGIPRPASVTKPALALMAVSAALFGIAKTTGSGWLIVVLAALGAILVLAVVLPAFGVLGVTATAEAPRDAIVGHSLALRIAVSGTRRPVVVAARGVLASVPTSVSAPASGRLDVKPQRRGIVDVVRLDVRCGAPLGLVWWRRSITIALDRPIEVGPWPADVAVPPPAGSGPQGYESRSAPHPGDDLVRGAREYRPGDPIKTIHWAASARHGDLMVKEMEAAAAPPVTVAVDLRAGGDEAERAAALGAGVAVAALDAGIPVTLLTCEREGGVAGEVATRTDVSRRLARATAGLPADPPRAAGHVIVVDGGGVHW